MSYEAIEKHGGIQWPYPAGSSDVKTTSLYSDGDCQRDDGKAKLCCVEWKPFPEQPNREFPFVLNTGRTVEHWHTRTKTGQVPILERMSPNAWLEMNPKDAKKLKLKPHDQVNVVSARGWLCGVELRVTEIIAPRPIIIPFHYSETHANQVTQRALRPISPAPSSS